MYWFDVFLLWSFRAFSKISHFPSLDWLTHFLNFQAILCRIHFDHFTFWIIFRSWDKVFSERFFPSLLSLMVPFLAILFLSVYVHSNIVRIFLIVHFKCKTSNYYFCLSETAFEVLNHWCLTHFHGIRTVTFLIGYRVRVTDFKILYFKLVLISARDLNCIG